MKSDKTPSEMLSLRVPQSVINDLDAAAEKNNRTRSKESLYRLKHYPVPLTPALMADLENKKNQKEETIISKSGTLRLSVDKTFTKNKKRKCC